MPTYSVRPIGHVENEITQLRRIRWEAHDSRIVVNPGYADGLDGLDEFSHIIVITYLHRQEELRPGELHVRPQGRPDMPSVGLFATRSPRRPNPIGVTVVPLLRRDGNVLLVHGLDAANDTPVLDIKPYLTRGDQLLDATVAEWTRRLWEIMEREAREMEIRDFEPKDADRIVEILKANQQYGHPDIDGPEAMQRVSDCQAAEFLVAEQDGQVVGMIRGVFDGSRAVIYIASVHPNYQRRGIGRDLVRAIVSRFRDRGAKNVSAVIPGEVAFWSRLSFRQTTRIMTAYPIDMVLEG